MNKLSNLKAVALAASVCAGSLFAMPAHAFVYALSHLEIQNLTLNVTNVGAAAAVNSFTFNLTNTASLNGGPVASGATCNSTGSPACSAGSPVLNAAVVNAPGSAPLRAENNFSFLGTSPAGSYSNSDSVINTAAVVQGVPTSSNQIAEALLNTNGFAASTSITQSNTSLSFTVTGAGTVNLSFSFMADPDQMTQIFGETGTYLSQSDLSATFSLNKAGSGDFVTWAPRGTAGTNDCISSNGAVSCSEVSDSQSLNFNSSIGTNPGMDQNSFENAPALTPFGINIAGLSAGNYTLTLAANTSTSIIRNVQDVPEPATLGLVGLALAGLGVVTARRNRKAAQTV